MSQQRRHFSGNTLQQAILLAARHHEADPSEIAYRELEKKHGFLRSRRRVVIEVDPESPLQQKEEEPEGVRNMEAREPLAEPSAPRFEQRDEARQGQGGEGVEESDEVEETQETQEAEETEELGEGSEEEPERPSALSAEVAEEAMDILLDVADLDVEFDVEAGEERFNFDLWGEGERLQLADRGELLLALQHLMPRAMRGLEGDSLPCRVDCAGFHQARQERLGGIARREADWVREENRPRTLAPMAPDERRIVHLALVDDEDVATESEGHGLFKRVTIRPSRSRPRGF